MIHLLKIRLAVCLVALVATQASAEQFVRIVSGPAGGNWYPLGAKMAERFGAKLKNVTASNAPGGGIGNINDVDAGSADVGFTFGHSAFDGFKGKSPNFKDAKSNIRHMATLFTNALQTAVPATSSIKTYADLRDKNLSPGKANWSGFAAAKMIFSKYGFTVEDIRKNGGTIQHVSYSESVALMKDGHIDAFTGLAAVPQASFLNLEFDPGIRFLPVDSDVLNKITQENPGFASFQITNEHYKSVTTPIPTLAAVTTLIVNKNTPEDVVHGITKALWESHADLVSVKQIWKSVSLKNALVSAAIPVHPGAMRYYQEQGVKASPKQQRSQ